MSTYRFYLTISVDIHGWMRSIINAAIERRNVARAAAKPPLTPVSPDTLAETAGNPPERSGARKLFSETAAVGLGTLTKTLQGERPTLDFKVELVLTPLYAIRQRGVAASTSRTSENHGGVPYC